MREIKFRAMAYMNTWVYGMPVFYENGEASMYYNTCPQYGYEATNVAKMRDKINPNTIGQYTGLKDKNGKEIYEGDIVECGYGKAQVVFNAGCFMVQWLDDSESMMELLSMKDYKFGRIRKEEDEFEIIGNIHQSSDLLTPELLKDK